MVISEGILHGCLVLTCQLLAHKCGVVENEPVATMLDERVQRVQLDGSVPNARQSPSQVPAERILSLEILFPISFPTRRKRARSLLKRLRAL